MPPSLRAKVELSLGQLTDEIVLSVYVKLDSRALCQLRCASSACAALAEAAAHIICAATAADGRSCGFRKRADESWLFLLGVEVGTRSVRNVAPCGGDAP